MRRAGVAVEAAERHAPATRPSSDIVTACGIEVLPAADPEPVVAVVVLAARRRAHRAQLRVDVRAVEALVVVLDDQLPVRRQLVVVRGADDEALGLVTATRGLDAGEVLGDRRRVAASVHHDPAVPLLDGDRHEPVLGAGRTRRARRSAASTAACRRGRSASRGTGSGSSGARSSTPHGTSSWPRCWQTLKKPRSSPSSPRTSSTASSPTRDGPPGADARRGRPTGRRTPSAPAKKCVRSHASTASSR